jgi:hypothetical protein
MRHPESTLTFSGGQSDGCGALVGIMRLFGWPRLPEDSYPGASGNADGRQALALHPALGLRLPASAARPVSCGPSSGKRRGPSRQMRGLSDATLRPRFAPDSPKVHE